MKIGLMGFGHLGRAVLQGLLNMEGVNKADVLVAARSQETLWLVRERFGVQTCTSNEELVRAADVVFIMVPPHVFRQEQILADWSGKAVISMMAGVKLAELRARLGGDPMRAMPNLGVAVNAGMICYTPTGDQRVVSLLEGLGEAFCVEEADVEKVMALASCGIGFAAHILHSFVQAGESMGFSQELSMRMVKNVFSYAMEAPDFQTLAAQVATKGGATEAGIASLVADDVAGAVERAVDAAFCKMK